MSIFKVIVKVPRVCDLLLQSHDAGPFLLKQSLVLFPCRIVEAGRDVDFFSESCCCLRGTNNPQICQYSLVTDILSVQIPLQIDNGCAHSSSACRSVNIVLMAEVVYSYGIAASGDHELKGKNLALAYGWANYAQCLGKRPRYSSSWRRGLCGERPSGGKKISRGLRGSRTICAVKSDDPGVSTV
jgi:hypothetical protein